jgi:hypothetical protein
MMHGYSDTVGTVYAVGFEGGVRMFIDFQAEPVKKR